MFQKDDRHARRRAFRPTVTGLEDRSLQTVVPSGYSFTTISGLTKPTSLALAPDGRVFVAEQYGKVRLVEGGRLLPAPVLALRVNAKGERGVIGLAVDPNFSTSPWLYVYYTVPGGSGTHPHNRLSRFFLVGNVALPATEQVLLDLPPLDDEHHNGGSLTFGRDGKLYVGVGENDHPERSQSLNTPFGKVLRINPDGSIPRDNPFYAKTKGINRAIWAYGLRNPFSTAVDRKTGAFYINDVGQDSWEEVNVGVRGANYGWPLTEGPTKAPKIRGPLFAYPHPTTDDNAVAIVGAAFDNPARPLVAAGSYYFADITGKFLLRLTPDGRTHPFARSLPFVPTDLEIDSAGKLYVVSQGHKFDGGVITVISRSQ